MAKKFKEEMKPSMVSDVEAAYILSPKSSTKDTLWTSLGINANLDDDEAVLILIRKGLKMSILSKLMIEFKISIEDTAALLHTTDRTLRRYEPNHLLNMEQTERIIELLKLYNYGAPIFGSLDKFIFWINAPIRSLNFASPKSYLDTSIGIRIITHLIGRMDYGIYS